MHISDFLLFYVCAAALMAVTAAAAIRDFSSRGLVRAVVAGRQRTRQLTDAESPALRDARPLPPNHARLQATAGSRRS